VAELLVKITLLWLFICIAFYTSRRASAATRHLLLSVGLASSLLLPVFSQFLPQWRLPLLPAWATGASESPQPTIFNPGTSLESENNRAAQRPAPQSLSGVSGRGKSKAPQAAPPESLSRYRTPPPSAVSDAVAITASQRLEPSASQKQDLQPFLFWLWGAGCCLLLANLGISHLRLRRMLKRALPVRDPQWLELAHEVKEELEIRRPATLLVSDEIDVPMTMAVLYPKIMLPPDAHDWPASRRRIVLLHEFAHVKRCDALSQLLAQLALSVYWFYPLAWWAVRKMTIEREHACDDSVLAAGAKASEYATDLLEIGARAQGKFADAAALAMARRSQLEGRLLAVLDKGVNRKPASAGLGAAVISFILVFSLPLATLHASAKSPRGAAVSLLTAVAPSAPSEFKQASMHETAQKGSEPAAATPPPQNQIPSRPAQDEYQPATALPLGGDSQSPTSTPASSVSVAVTSGYSDSTPVNERLQAFDCRSDGRSNSQSMHSDNGRRTWKAVWSGVGPGGEHCQISLYAEGQIVFSPDLTAIQSITPGGYLELSESVGSHYRRLLAKPDASGGINLSWSLDGQSQPLDSQQQHWLSEFLLALERQTGLSAETRVPALLKKGGPQAVLDEVDHMQGDFARSRYLMLLLGNARLSDAQLLRVINFTGKNMVSDYERARVLMTISQDYPLADETSRKAFVASANGLKSDYEHARVLMEVLRREHLSPQTRNMAIESVVNIKSDYERARVLTAANCACNGSEAAPLPQIYFDAADSIHSDYEHSRVLQDVLRRKDITREHVEQILKSARKIGSDYERSRVLSTIIERHLLDDSMAPLYLEDVGEMKSDNEHASVLIALINSNQLKTDLLEKLIQSAASIRSDHELSRVLVALAGAYPLKAGTRAAYVKAAQQIKSEYERNRALAAVNSTML
jgi:beta-lactamase regulating signal transducer with metallopeptidase domain